MNKPSKEAQIIFKAIEPRLIELWNKLIKGNYNKGTHIAYWIGFVADIDNSLKKLKSTRTKNKYIHQMSFIDKFKKFAIGNKCHGCGKRNSLITINKETECLSCGLKFERDDKKRG